MKIKKNNIKVVLLFLFIINIFLSSCNKNAQYNYYIQNNSTSKIKFTGGIDPKTTTLNINEKIPVGVYRLHGESKVDRGLSNDILKKNIGIAIYKNDTILSHSDYFNIDRWYYIEFKKDIADCILTITDADF